MERWNWVPYANAQADSTSASRETSKNVAARWSAEPNVFTRARTLGYDTALIGSHLPYPRVLGVSLGVADWRPSAAHDVARGDKFGESLWDPWASLAPPVNRRRLSVRRFEELSDLALRTAADERFGLVLLHLPVPQPPGIYDRAAGRLTPWNFTGAEGGYLDNLALADRTDVPDLRRFIRAVVQADAYGVSIADVLRTQAQEMRLKRRQRAEEKAMQIPVKVIFPLILCILPTLFIVLLGPAVMDIIAAFSR